MKVNAKRLNHVTIAVPAGEHEKVRAFYGGLLGLEEIPRPAALNAVYDLMWFKFLDILLHLDFTPPWVQPAENRHVAFEVGDLRRFAATWRTTEPRSARRSPCRTANAFIYSTPSETISNSSKCIRDVCPINGWNQKPAITPRWPPPSQPPSSTRATRASSS